MHAKVHLDDHTIVEGDVDIVKASGWVVIDNARVLGDTGTDRRLYVPKESVKMIDWGR